MFKINDEIDFFSKCEIDTSPFNKEFAKTDSNWNLIKNIYGLNHFTNNPIPKVIHFIWLGGNLPDKYASIIDDWKQKTNFDIHIWNDDDSEKFLKDKKSYSIFHRTKSFGIKSDVLRYELLNALGGVYIDTDFLCCSSSFGLLHDSVSFYAGMLLDKHVQTGNGIIGSSPGHPIINICINNVDDTRYIDVISCPETRTLYQSGPWLLTAAILMHIKSVNNNNDLIIFPSQSFHPFPAVYRENQSLDFIKGFIKPWTLACHLWHCSWQPKSKHFQGK